jgi:hypothetical protein
MVIDDSPSLAQLPLLLSGYLVMAGCRLTLSLFALRFVIRLLSDLVRLLGVLLSDGAVLGLLSPVCVDRAPQLLGLRDMSIRLLTVTSCFGGKPLSQGSLPLRPATHVGKQGHQCGHGDYDYRDDENR